VKNLFIGHSRKSGNLFFKRWIPAFAGMTKMPKRFLVFFMLGATAALAQTSNWPNGTHQQFVQSCAAGRANLIAPCRCVISNLTASMTQEEFLKLSQANAIETDSRYTRARTACIPPSPRR
jgi:hypothetical protein